MSHGLFSLNRLKIDFKVSTRFSLFPRIPSSGLNCDVAIFIAAADVKPAITGSDIKSSKKPVIEKNERIIIILYLYINISNDFNYSLTWTGTDNENN